MSKTVQITRDGRRLQRKSVIARLSPEEMQIVLLHRRGIAAELEHYVARQKRLYEPFEAQIIKGQE